MMDSNRITAKRREAKPRTHAKPKTTKTIKDFDPAGLNNDPFAVAVGIFTDWLKLSFDKLLK
jgi:hypothetical protein